MNKKNTKNIASQKSFSRQLFLVFVFGMLSLALITSVATTWYTGKQIRDKLIEESLQITLNLASRSSLALIYGSGENAVDAAETTLAFPGVIGLAIMDLDGNILLKEGDYETVYEYPDKEALKEGAKLIHETEKRLYFTAPVYEPVNSQEQSMIFTDVAGRNMLGRVHVAIDKEPLIKYRNSTLISNTSIAVIVTVFILFLLHAAMKKLTNPLNKLSETMMRAQKGEKGINVELTGPKEIASIASVFNNMMVVLEERQEELFREKEQALITLESIADAVITTDTLGNIVYLNPAAEYLIGIDFEEAIHTDVTDLFKVFNTMTHLEEENPIKVCLDKGKMSGPHQHELFRIRLSDTIYIKDSVAPIKGRDGNITGAVMVFHDETAARELQKKLSYQATHDMLTGLTNRTEFENQLNSVIERMEPGTEHSLCYLDLDQFKVINDTCGHMAGDQLLQNITELLQRRIKRKEDKVARLGGDEFVILLENCALHDAQRIANELCQAVHEYRFVFSGKPFVIGVSIGVVSLNIQSVDYQDILGMADAACFMAKERGRNRVHVYYPDDKDLIQRHGEMQVVSQISEAFDDDNFFLFYQPIVPVNQIDEITRHYEILLRMQNSDGNWLSPGYFLPAAERFNMSNRIDRMVIRKTLKWLQEHPEHLSQLRSCSINLAGISLNDETLFDYIHEQFEQTNVPPRKICFEITETSAITHLAGATTLISKLRELGCQTALDDFGSGMSSFAYLKNFPIDYLKIDGLFVRDIIKDPIDDAMVKSINDIGHILGLSTIAEYVENEQILYRLRELGIDMAQGYHIAKPEPLDTLLTIKNSSEDKPG